MRFELPDCKRCCLCVPLRHGILIFGYLNLFFSIFLIGIQTWIVTHRHSFTSNTYLYRGVLVDTPLWCYYVLYSLEVIFNTVLLVGAHGKIIKVIKIYYYYGITTTVMAFIGFLFEPYFFFRGWYFDPLLIWLAFCAQVLQCYLLLLVRTELKKLQFRGGQFQFVNHTAQVIMLPSPEETDNPV